MFYHLDVHDTDLLTLLREIILAASLTDPGPEDATHIVSLGIAEIWLAHERMEESSEGVMASTSAKSLDNLLITPFSVSNFEPITKRLRTTALLDSFCCMLDIFLELTMRLKGFKASFHEAR